MNQEKYKNRNKKRQKYQNQKRETPAPREAYELNEHLNKSIKYPVSERANTGSSEAT